MADRRMFSKRITQTAKFLQMPVSSQLLYFHLGLNADDDGIVEAFPIMRMVNSGDDDLKVLVAKGYIKILNEDLIIFICDWRENNQIRADRKKDSIYKNLLIQFIENSENTSNLDITNQMTTTCQPNDNQMTTKCQHRLGKDRLGKDSIGEDRLGKDNKEECDETQNKKTQKPTFEEIKEYCDTTNTQIDIQAFIDYYEERDWKRYDKNLKKYISIKNWKSAIRNWSRNQARFEEEREINLGSKKAYIKEQEEKHKTNTQKIAEMSQRTDMLEQVIPSDMAKALEIVGGKNDKRRSECISGDNQKLLPNQENV